MAQSTSDAVRLLAADDLAIGEYVVVMSDTAQIPSFYWCLDSIISSRTEMIGLKYIPSDAGHPLKTKAICLPFLLVEDFAGRRRILDVRQRRIARVIDEFAEKTRKSLAKNEKRSAPSCRAQA